MGSVPSIKAAASGEASQDLDWDGVRAPSSAEFEILAQAAYDRLPEDFRKLCADLVINVTEFPEDDVLKELGAESPFDLLGLFSGIGLPQQGYAPQTGQMTLCMPFPMSIYSLQTWASDSRKLHTVHWW